MDVTYNAITELKKLSNVKNNPVAGIRVTVWPGCCAPKLKVAVADKIAEGEKQISIDGVSFFFDGQTEGMLSGFTIDYDGSNGFKLDFMKSNGGCCR